MFENLVAIPPNFSASDGKRLSLLAYLFLVMLCVAFFTPGFATMPPTDRDESLFAQASKQMIESGDHTDIRVQSEPRYKKPIGIYWLQSTSASIFSPDHLNQIWVYRLPSLAGATIAVLLTAALGTLLFNPATGLLAAIMLAGSVLLNVEARLATTDATLLACIMAAIYGLARAYMGQATRWGVPLLFWTAVAAGVLVKGPIVLLPLVGTLLWLKIADKQVAWFKSLRPLLGIFYALILIAPWFIAISLHSHGAFIHQSAGQDMLAKLWQGQNRGMVPPGMYLLFLPISFFPFALFIVFAAPDAWKNRKDAAIKFCLGWIIPTWIVFEVAQTKLPHYVLPTYPALAILAAKYLLDGFPTIASTTRRLSVALIIGLWFAIGIGFAAAFALMPAFVDGTWLWPQILVGVALMLSQGIAMLVLSKDKSASIVALTVGSMIFMTATFGDTLPRLQHLWVSREIVDSVNELATCAETQIISTGYHEPSLVFLAGTNTILAANGVEAAAALKQDPCRIAVIGNADKPAFLFAFNGDAQQPVEASTIQGLNTGHGAKTTLTLYKFTAQP
jgi:4-amino-4-deoxy-L-arabinose transferase-like glycosyltransferase